MSESLNIHFIQSNVLSDSELDESEKRPSETSLDFLTSWLIAGGARNLQFLRGDWKVSYRSHFFCKTLSLIGPN